MFLFYFWFQRPGSKVEENMFTRLVQLDRLTEKSRKDEILELFGQRHSGDPDRYLGDTRNKFQQKDHNYESIL